MDNTDTYIQQAQTLLDAAKRSVLLFSHSLTPAIYQHPNVINSLSSYLRKSKYCQARVIITAPKQLSITHPMVKLAHRLPSSLSIKTVTQLPDTPPPFFLLADSHQLLEWVEEDHNKGTYNESVPAQAKHHSEVFLHLWERYSIEIPELAQLHV